MQTVYVDTSVFGGCYETDHSKDSLQLLNEFKRGEKKMMISELVIEELNDARHEIRILPLEVPVIFSIMAPVSFRARMLAQKYIQEGVLSAKSIYDALHIATATLQGANTVASLNFRHMVNSGKIKHINAINTGMGFRTIEIKTPKEIINPSL